MNFRSAIWVLLLSWLLSCTTTALGQGSDAEWDERYFEGLRDRGLFSLLESSLQEKLERDDLKPRHRAQYCLELSRTLTEHAEHLLGDEQQQHWRLASEYVERGIEAHDPARWNDELLVQRARIDLSKGQTLLEQWRLFPHDRKLADRTIEQLKVALTELKRSERELEQSSKIVLSRYRSDSTAISPFEHRQLQRQLEFLVARTQADLSELGVDDVNQRRTPLQLAQLTANSLAEGSADESLTWQARLLQIRCERLAGDLDAAMAKLNEYRDQVPAAQRNRFLNEEAKVLLAGKRPDLAVARLRESLDTSGVLPGELSLTYLKILGELWSIADSGGDATLAQEIFKQIDDYAARTRTDVGGIWAYRSQLFLQQMQQSQKYGAEFSEQIQKAQSLYQSGDPRQAEHAYEQIARTAEQQGESELAAEMFFTAGSIAVQRQDWSRAAELFHSVPARLPATSRAAECHLMYAYCLGKKYEQSPTKTNRQQYTDVLEAHLATFPERKTVGDAHMMLGQLEENRLQVTKAVQQYLAVDPSHARAAEADRAAIRCYDKILNRLEELGQPQAAWRQEAIEVLSRRVQSYPPAPEQLNVTHIRVLLGLARLILAHSPVNYQQANQYLRTALQACESSRDGSADRQSLATSARQLRILALAGEGKVAEAEALVSQLSETGNQQVLELLDGLGQLASNVDRSQTERIGELQLKTCLALNRRREHLTPEEQHQLDLCLAQAYLATERSTEAIEIYRRILDARPDDLKAREELARELVECGTQACLYEALGHWKYLVGSRKQGSTEWLAARLQEIVCLVGTDQKRDARTLLRKTELLYPELGGESLKRSYETLKSELESAP